MTWSLKDWVFLILEILFVVSFFLVPVLVIIQIWLMFPWLGALTISLMIFIVWFLMSRIVFF